jgi:hypothetical protein
MTDTHDVYRAATNAEIHETWDENHAQAHTRWVVPVEPAGVLVVEADDSGDFGWAQLGDPHQRMPTMLPPGRYLLVKSDE